MTIAFLDSGFYAHPDLVEPLDRIARYVDITQARRRREDLDRPDVSSWHGMMTSVVAAGTERSPTASIAGWPPRRASSWSRSGR